MSLVAIIAVNDHRNADDVAQLEASVDSYNAPGDVLPTGTGQDVRAAVNRAWQTYISVPYWMQQRLSEDKSPSGYWLQQALAARQLYRRAHPILDQYLAYQELQGGRGTAEEFLRQRSR